MGFTASGEHSTEWEGGKGFENQGRRRMTLCWCSGDGYVLIRHIEQQPMGPFFAAEAY